MVTVHSSAEVYLASHLAVEQLEMCICAAPPTWESFFACYGFDPRELGNRGGCLVDSIAHMGHFVVPLKNP